MSKFLEIGEILDFPTPKVEVVTKKLVAEPVIQSNKKSNILPIIVIAAVATGLVLIVKHYEKSTDTRNKS